MKEIVVKILEKELGGKLKKEEIESLVEIPPQQEMGDFAFPCFSLAKIEKKSPLMIAQDLVEKIRKNLPKEISGVELKSAYVNFFIDKKFLAEKVLKEATKKGYGKQKISNKKVGIEFPSPNTNKALHVGHMRNMAVGCAVSNLCELAGDKVTVLNLFNDRGILICKAMMGYEMYGEGKKPGKENGDAFVGNFYVRFSQESEKDKKLDELAQEKLKKWEEGDKETLALWKKINSWAYSGMEKTFKKFGLRKAEKNYYESEIYLNGKEIIADGLKKGIFQKREDGAVHINLESEGFGDKVLLRNDGTAVYMTTDLYLAKKKIDDFKLDSSYYVVGCDQEYHFKVLFNILEKLGLKKDWKHLSYGMVVLPEGKMSSRQGNAVSAEGLISETQNMAKEGLKQRNLELSDKELDNRSLAIALSAIKYHLLKVDPHKDIIFNPKESLDFEGNTGPYLLYAYARASSIIRKAKDSKKKVEIFDLSKEESALLTKIGNYPEVVKKAYLELAPNLVANYSYELCQMFNEFYHASQVIGSKEEVFRLKLIDAFRNTLKSSLNLLGIDELEEM
ncbi:arginine--tRNA ligase [Candidatus Pacearchaeota archaeon]|nr:arginine--tRNA ligase [Candidatus Pacearchaeota archaeon]